MTCEKCIYHDNGTCRIGKENTNGDCKTYKENKQYKKELH